MANPTSTFSSDPRLPFEHSDEMQPTEPDARYKISNDRSQWTSIHEFMSEHEDDPAVKVCVDKYLVSQYTDMTF